jgi:glycosyltransferase involved in cell wall biosynthesis
MKIILFPSTCSPVGVAKNILTLALALKNKKYDVFVFCVEKGWLDNELKKNNIPYIYVKGKPTFSGLFFGNFSVLMNLLKIRGRKVLHLNGRMTLFLSIVSRFVLPSVKQVYSVRQFSAVGSKGLFSWKESLENLLMKFQYRVHTVSYGLAKELTNRSGIKKENIFTIPNFLYNIPAKRNDKIFKRFKNKKKQIRVVGAGRLSYEKGFDLLVSAFADSRLKRLPISLDIYGEGAERKVIEDMISKYDIKDKVCLMGEVSTMKGVFNKYDIVVIPSRSESFGLVALEAFQENCPVIATDIPGLKEVASDKIAKIVKPNSVNDLSDAIFTLYSDPRLCDRLGLLGNMHFKKFYKQDVIISKFINFYS